MWKCRIWSVSSKGNTRMTMVEGYTRATNTLGMETIATLSSAPGLETHHLNMSMIGIHGGQLER